ncbi:protodermal factor 1-like [Magnolia sinica]|uniref:protodermal factor 1-like n=1 Tax=Magnolia sinica TaxID=86752 RepID=UPI002659EF81|nr:protodermal factor 1-like [Magnolia sinica]
MERGRSKNGLVMWVVLVGLVSQNVLMPVMCRSLQGVEDQKNYYSPDPHHGSTPKSSHKSPTCKTPSHGSGGSGGSHGTPSHGSGGGSYGTPPQGGGGYYNSPPTSPSITPPTYNPVTPSTPPVVTDPYTPPVVTDPYTPPVVTDPYTPPSTPSYPGTCNYWGKHPQLIWGIFGFWGTMAGVFGALCTPVYGQNLSIQQALLNTRSDAIGSLYREGAASLLNSMVNHKFPYTTQEVKDRFSAALASNKVAADQAQLFKLANEGRLKLRA